MTRYLPPRLRPTRAKNKRQREREWICAECGGPIRGEIVQSFLVQGNFCSSTCAERAVRAQEQDDMDFEP
jgi:hypothetical protein